MSDRLLTVFAAGLGIPETDLSDATSPENTRAWTSLAAMNLVALIEEEFEVELSTRDIMRMRSIRVAREVLHEKGVASV